MASPRRAPGALFCDTNVLIRLLADDPPGHAAAVQRALEASGDGRYSVIVTDVVLAEIAYVLTGAYGRSRTDAAGLMRGILELPGVEVADPWLARETLELWSSRNMDFADAYLAATAVSLARELGCVPPAWTRSERRSLPYPWFASEGVAIRATLLAESPAPFRERNLFVSANALSRA